ncbi:MAG TPA: hypothetical protein VL137_08770 [Polyangiaceae bacterium]|jgi:hypothetical protein|nr:hypothetical protein [Polyangiaceae bacterium]
MPRFTVTIAYREPMFERYRRRGRTLYTSCFGVTAETDDAAVGIALAVFRRIEMLSSVGWRRGIEVVTVVEGANSDAIEHHHLPPRLPSKPS